jgi:hypothetical protein
MRAVFVLTTIMLALALGIIAAASESRLLIRVLVIGFVPVAWGVSHVLERLTGRDMWHFTAPYPNQSKRERGETASPRPDSVEKAAEDPREIDLRSTFPWAA